MKIKKWFSVTFHDVINQFLAQFKTEIFCGHLATKKTHFHQWPRKNVHHRKDLCKYFMLNGLRLAARLRPKDTFRLFAPDDDEPAVRKVVIYASDILGTPPQGIMCAPRCVVACFIKLDIDFTLFGITRGCRVTMTDPGCRYCVCARSISMNYDCCCCGYLTWTRFARAHF